VTNAERREKTRNGKQSNHGIKRKSNSKIKMDSKHGVENRDDVILVPLREKLEIHTI